MQEKPLRTSVIGSYPLPAWLEFAAQHLDQFGEADIRELQEDAVVVAVQDQLQAGLDVITDGEQSRLDFNLSFYGHLRGIEVESEPPRRWGPPAHDQRGRHRIEAELHAPQGLGVLQEFERLRRLAPASTPLKVSVPGPYTLSGRLLPNPQYPDRWAITEALLPIVQREIQTLIAAGCREICVDEPSMSCYAYQGETHRFVDIFNRTVEPARGQCRIDTHLCFGNYKGRGVGKRDLRALFPDFLDFHADELHLEMTTTHFAHLDVIREVAQRMDVGVGVIDVKSYYVESPEEVAEVVRHCLQHAPPERLVFAPDCGLSQTARWAARQKLKNMVEGVRRVRESLRLERTQ
jgi:5-methyltetrahydropteroyltriglutamate--homocysteine methyltransferase